MKEVDVAVVGAGVGGSACAFHLAQAGRSVVVLEQGDWPRSKACGGGMAASVQRWFPFDLSPAVDQVIRQVRFTWCLEDPVTAVLPGDSPFWIVRRSRLDAFLIEQATLAGAELQQQWPVHTVNREGSLWRLAGPAGELFARSVVIADGSSSRLAGPLGLGPAKPRFATTMSVELEGATSEPDTARFEFGLVRHGFCWAFPRQGGFSIGVGTFIGRDASDQAAQTDAVLDQLLPSLGFQAGDGERRGGQLRIWDGHHRLHGDGLIVVGDGASLCDPFLAEGIRPALMSGTYGAQALDRWLGANPGSLAEYTVTMRQAWGESMAWGKRIAQVFYRVPKVGYQLGIKRPTAPQRIAQILSGEMGYGDIAQRVIRRLLFQGNR